MTSKSPRHVRECGDFSLHARDSSSEKTPFTMTPPSVPEGGNGSKWGKIPHEKTPQPKKASFVAPPHSHHLVRFLPSSDVAALFSIFFEDIEQTRDLCGAKVLWCTFLPSDLFQGFPPVFSKEYFQIPDFGLRSLNSCQRLRDGETTIKIQFTFLKGGGTGVEGKIVQERWSS